MKGLADKDGMWLLILVIYAAPAGAVNWKGSWELEIAKLMEERYESEAECLNTAIQIKTRLNEDMLAPVRFKCIEIEAGLPAGAAR